MKTANTKLIMVSLTIVGMIVSAGIAVFLLMPTLREIGRLSDKIIQAHSELEAQYLNRKNLLSSAEKVKTIRETTRPLAGQFLQPERELDFITAVEEIAAKNGVEERMILSDNDDSKASKELKVGFDITLNGPWRSVLQTMVEIERMPNLLIFDTAVIRPGKGETDASSYLSVSLHGSLVSPPSVL